MHCILVVIRGSPTSINTVLVRPLKALAMHYPNRGAMAEEEQFAEETAGGAPVTKGTISSSTKSNAENAAEITPTMTNTAARIL